MSQKIAHFNNEDSTLRSDILLYDNVRKTDYLFLPAHKLSKYFLNRPSSKIEKGKVLKTSNLLNRRESIINYFFT